MSFCYGAEDKMSVWPEQGKATVGNNPFPINRGISLVQAAVIVFPCLVYTVCTINCCCR